MIDSDIDNMSSLNEEEDAAESDNINAVVQNNNRNIITMILRMEIYHCK